LENRRIIRGKHWGGGETWLQTNHPVHVYMRRIDVGVLHIIYYYYCEANIICRTSDRQDSTRGVNIYSTRLPIRVTTKGMPTPGQTSINYRPRNYDVPLYY